MPYEPLHASRLPPRAGVGFKPEHYADIVGSNPDLGFLEVHAENFMGDGGMPHRMLAELSARYALSLHGVGLSIGAARPLDKAHLSRLRHLIDRYRPQSFSEHLAWSTHDTGFLNDLLPLPYTPETLARVADHVDEVQQATGRQILLENPSTYVLFEESCIDEIDFLDTVAERTGCGLLLDVNNVFVSATNQQTSAEAYIDAFPLDLVGEIHLGGHAEDADDHGAPLLIDSHGRPVVDPVWALYARTLARGGARPTLIEWDNDVPDWPVLEAEAARAAHVLADVA
jgi:uncharacterized protein (UPF0276 family)